MKKHLIAAAVAAAVAVPAAAQVTVYGILDHSFTSIKTDTTNSSAVTSSAKATDTGNSGRLSGSRLGFRGTEDLGSGLKAGFVLELGADATEQFNSLGNGTRLGYLEISGAFGSVRAGRQVSETKAVIDGFTAFGNASFTTGSVTGGGLNSGSVSQATGANTNSLKANVLTEVSNANAGERVSNLLRYQTPTFSGLTAAVGYAKVNTDTSATANGMVAGTANGKATEASVRYAAGPVAVMVAQSKYSTTDGSVANSFTTENKLQSYGASYQLGGAKLFATINDRKYEVAGSATMEFEDTTVGVSYPMGSVTLLAALAQGEASQTTTSYDKDGFQLGAVYNFSKRTNAYAVYGQGESSKNNASDKVKNSGYAIGVRHSF